MLSIDRDITERNQVEAENARLAAIVDSSEDAIFSTTREGLIATWNAGAEHMYGYSAEEVRGKHFAILIPEDKRGSLNASRERLNHGEALVRYQAEHIRKDGSRLQMSLTLSPLKDAAGSVTGVSAIARDTTQRKQAEAALRESEGKYRSLVSNIPDVVWTVDDKLRFVFISKNIERISGYSPEEVYEKGAQIYLDSLHPDDVQKVSEGFRTLLTTGQPFDVECRMKRKDGEWIWVHDRAIAAYEKDGIRYADGLLSDITERKRVEAEMAERHRLATLVAEVGVVLTRAESLRQGLQQCAEILVRNIGVVFARVWTVNEEENVLELQASAGMYTHLDDGHARVPVGKFKIGRIAENGEPHLTNLVQEDSWVGDPEWARREGLSAFAGYPLKVDGRVLGVVAAFSRQPLTEKTLQAFASMADNTAQFIKRKGAEQQTHLQTAALESAANGIVIASPDGRIIWVNRAFTRLTGYPASEAIGKNPRILKSGVHDAVFYQKLWNTVISGQVWQGELVNRRKDGTLYNEAMTITPVRDAAGTISHFIAIKQDITGRKRAEQTILQSEERYRTLFENSPVGIYRTTPDGRILAGNPALVRMLGYSSFEELAANNLNADGFGPEYPRSHFMDLLEKRGETTGLESVWHNQNGDVLHIRENARAIRDESGTILFYEGTVEDITEQKRIAKELQEERNFLEAVLDSAQSGIIACNDRGVLTLFNKASREMFGLPLEASPLEEWAHHCDLYHADGKTLMKKEDIPIFRALEGEHLSNVEMTIIPKHLGARGVLASGQPIIDSKGRNLGAVVAFHDITERKQAEQALHESQSRLQAIVDSVQAGIVIIDPEANRIVDANPVALELIGAPREQVVGAVCHKFICPAEVGRCPVSNLHQMVDNSERVLLTVSGGRREIIKTVVPVVIGGRKHLLESFIDITERKRAEQALLFKTALLEAQSETTIDGILVVDTTGQVLLANKQFAKMWDFPEKTIRTNDDSKLIEHVRAQVKAPEAFMEKVRYLYAHSDQESRDEIELKNGRVFDRYSSPLQDSAGTLYGRIWYFRDITDRRELERMKSEIVSVVSHELRTPLTSIRGALGLLAGGLLRSNPEKGERMLEIAVSNTDRLVRLINDILDLERMESGKMSMEKQTCNAADLMAQAADSVRELAEKAGVALSVSLHSARLWVDPDRAIQAFINLLSNAIKFSSRGKTVWLSATPQADQILFQVRDQGRGIPKEKRESIFERFQQVDASDRREKGGTGLGLPITRSIVQQHGGRIWVESTLGQGSTFSFTLPFLPAEPILPRIGSGGRRVLLFAAKADICSAVQAVLKPQGCSVMVSASWEEVIDRATIQRPDAILLDSSMPGMESEEAMTALMTQALTLKVPLIGLGDTAPEGARLAAMGMAGWVTKPLGQGALLHALASVLGKPKEGPRVLVVEDDTDLARVLTAIFERHGAVVVHSRTGREAIQVCKRFFPDLLVLDVMLPEIDGFGVVEHLRQHEYSQHLPVAVYSVKELDDSEKARLRLGESIFMTKSRLTPQEFEERAIGLLNWATSGKRERRRQ